MSHRIYLYARRRVYGPELGRSEFLRTFVKRLLKSIARSTGGRIHTNRWLRLIQELAAAHIEDGKGREFITDVLNLVSQYERTHPLTVARINLMCDIIVQRVFVDNDNRDYGRIMQMHDVAFQANNDPSWIEQVASKMGIHRASCDHYTDRRVMYTGSQEDVNVNMYVCHHCRDRDVSSGLRQETSHGEYVLSSFAVEYTDENSRRRIGDRRSSELRLHNGRWVHVNWSPYSNLVDHYHSSRAKGFHVIDSPWFRSHRRAFGCELEVQLTSSNMPVNTAAGKVHDVLNPSGNVGEYCYFERDGSIGHGFELITQPAGLDLHRQKFDLFLNNAELKRGLRSHEGGSCGFHVHVGRQYLTQAQIYRVQSFLNDVRNEGLIRMIARRYGAGYCRVKAEMAKFTSHGKHSNDRYEMLNVSNDKTVEFRIFRGSLRYESIAAALEFCNALLTFCQPGEVAFNQFNAVGFRQFITRVDMRSDTKFLRAYLNVNADTDGERSIAA
jgi:hypothetical protein